MASIKKLSDRKFKITISNGYRPNGKKICKAKTITVPDSVKPRGIRAVRCPRSRGAGTPGEIRFCRGPGHHL